MIQITLKQFRNVSLLFCLVPLLIDSPPGLQAAEQAGEHAYTKWCAGCHMDSPFAPGTIQLRHLRGEEQALIRERKDLSAAYVRQVVRKGMNGMPLFRRTEISNEELDALVELLAHE